MSTSKKRHQSHAALKGIESKNGFLADETLLQFVQGQSFQEIAKRYQNERMRSFRDQYREFDRKLTKHKETLKNADQRRTLLTNWFSTVRKYFGYEDFVASSTPHWDGEGVVPFLKSANGGHSVAVLFAAESSIAHDVETSGFSITTEDGSCQYKPNKKETLSEQVDRLIKVSGCAEAVLFLPQSAYYFRSESQTAGQYLELRFEDILLEDNDAAFTLTSHVLSADFFSYSQTVTETAAETDEDSDDAEGDNEEESSAGNSKTQSTASSLLFREDLEQARKITEDLHSQVTLALEILINERLEADPELKKKALTEKHNEAIAHQLFKDGLFVLYRILFILYAEARRFLPVENQQYASFYSMEHLRDWAEKFQRFEKTGQSDSSGTYLWGAFYSLFTLLRRGVKLHGGEYVSAFNGQLFAPDQTPLFDDGPALRDSAIAKVLMTLTRVGGAESGRKLHFANLGVEQLGSVYEAMLAQKPVIVREESLWVPAHGGGVGLVTKKLADALDMTVFPTPETNAARRPTARRRGRSAAGSLENFISRERPGFNPERGTFIVAPLGGQKRQTASFYTPPKLAEFLVKRTLKPLVEGKSVKEILALRIVEPAVGSGGFLIACLRYLGRELLKAKQRESEISLRGREPNIDDLQKCKREILESCLFGVDMNPLSLELCRTSLYLEALVKNQPLPFLHHRLKSGNSLIYADFLNMSRATDDEGKEYPSIFKIYKESLSIDAKIFDAWDSNEKAHGRRESSDSIQQAISNVKRTIDTEMSSQMGKAWADWAIKSQTKIDTLMQYARNSILEFEKLQSAGETVDSLDARHKDHLGWLPDLDKELIVAEGIEIDESLEKQRRATLVKEHGVQLYSRMVKHQRAYTRLKALGDIWCAQWFWPLDKMQHFPTPARFKELADFLLNESTLERTSKSSNKISRGTFDCLRVALKTARQHRFYQWNVEFSQVFGDKNKGAGFTSVISNPPWKVVGVDDNATVSALDPLYPSLTGAARITRLEKVSKISPKVSATLFTQQHFAASVCNTWQNGRLSPVSPRGQLDLSVLFTFAVERLLKTEGRAGLLVSRSAVLSNNATSDLRERFFTDWGLQESISFANFNGIFEIASYFQFTCIVGQPGTAVRPPKFVHGVVDLNCLDTLSTDLDAPQYESHKSRHSPILMTRNFIEKISGRTMSVPGFTSPRQVNLANAIFSTSGHHSQLGALDVVVRGGIHQKQGPINGLMTLTESIPARLRPDWNTVTSGRIDRYVPVVKGKDYDRFRSPTQLVTEFAADAERIRKLGFDLSKPSVAWRKISQSSDQRSLISSVLPPGIYADDSSYLIQSDVDVRLLVLFLSTLPLDYVTKLQGGANRTKGQILALPIANYNSAYLKEAYSLLKTKSNSPMLNANLDALMWLHYGFNQPAMEREGVIWALANQFETLSRNSPEYVQRIIEAFDRYSKEIKDPGYDPAPIFKLKSSVVEMPIAQKKPRTARKSAG